MKYRITKIIFAKTIKDALEHESKAETIDVELLDDASANREIGFGK